MALALALDQELSAYLSQRRSLDDVHNWLARHVQAVHDAADEALQDRVDHVWELIDSYSARRRDEQAVRDEILAMLQTRYDQWTNVAGREGQFSNASLVRTESELELATA
jgi:hypothetical protein